MLEIVRRKHAWSQFRACRISEGIALVHFGCVRVRVGCRCGILVSARLRKAGALAAVAAEFDDGDY